MSRLPTKFILYALVMVEITNLLICIVDGGIFDDGKRRVANAGESRVLPGTDQRIKFQKFCRIYCILIGKTFLGTKYSITENAVQNN